MKVLANETKRILAVLLSVAMIFAYVPNNVAAYADDEVPAEDATVEGGEVNHPELDYLDELELDLAAYSSTAPVNDWGFTYVNGLTTSGKGATDVYAAKKLSIHEPDDTTVATTSIGIDSTKDFQFVVSPDAGYELDDNFISKISYGVYTSKDSRRGVDLATSDYEIGAYDVAGFTKGSKLVTIPSSTLSTIAASVYSDPDTGIRYGTEIVVHFAAAGTASKPAKYDGISFNAIGGAKKKNFSSGELQCDASTNLVKNLSDLLSNASDLNDDNLLLTAVVKDGENIINEDVIRDAAANNGGPTWTGSFTANSDTQWVVINKSGDSGNGTLEIAKEAIAEAYERGYTMEITINAPIAAGCAIAYDGVDTDLVKIGGVTRTDAGSSQFSYATSTTVPSAVATGGDVYIEVTNATNNNDANRVIAAVYAYTTDGTKLTGAKVSDATAATASFAANVWKISSVNDDIVVWVDTTEKLKRDDADTHFLVVDEDGKTVDNTTGIAIDSSKDHDIFVIPADQYEVGDIFYATSSMSVEAKIGTGAGSVTIPGEGITSTVTVRPVVTKPTNQGVAKTVKLSAVNALVDVKPVTESGAGAVITDVNTAPTRVRQPFYFTIQGKDTTNLNTIIDDVSYVMGGDTGKPQLVAYTPAVTTPSSEAEAIYWYIIPSVTDDVVITVTATGNSDLVTLAAPNNKNATMIIGSTELDYTGAGSTMLVKKNQALSVAVVAEENVTLTGVSYKVDGSASETFLAGDNTGTSDYAKTKASAGTWSIPANVITDNTTFYVYTNETVDPDTFFAVFDSSQITDAKGYAPTAANPVAELLTYDRKGAKLDLNTVNTDTGNAALAVKDQQLKVAVSDTTFKLDGTAFYDYTNATKKAINSTLSGTLSYSMKDNAENLYVEDPDEIEGLATGSDLTLVATLTSALDNTAGLKNNRKVYNAELDVDVVDRYPVADIAIASDVDTIFVGGDGTGVKTGAKYVSTLQVVAKNGITGKYETLDAENNADIDSITWEFDPSIEKDSDPAYSFKSGDGSALTPSTIVEGVSGSQPYKLVRSASSGESDGGLVYVTSAKPIDSFSVKATLVYDDLDGTEVNVVKSGLKSIPASDKRYVALARVDGDMHKYNIATGTYTLGLGLYDPNAITVSYEVYEDLTPGQDYAIAGKTEAQIKTDLEDGKIGEVTGAVTIGEPVVTDGDNTIAVEKTGSTFTISAVQLKTALGANATVAIPNLFVNGVQQWIPGVTMTVPVAQRCADHRLNLVAYDIDSDKNVSEFTVSDDWYKGYIHNSIVGDDTNGGLAYTAPEYKKTIGTSLSKLGQGTSIQLPTEADLVGTKPAGRTLAGWAKLDNISTTTTGLVNLAGGTDSNVISSTGSTIILNPGDWVTINAADVSYRAVWTDAHTIEGIYNKNIPTLDAKKKTVYLQALTDTVVGSEIPTVLKITDTTGIKSATAAGTIAASTITYEGDSFYTEEFNLAMHKDSTAYADAVKFSSVSGNESFKTVIEGKATTSNNIKVTATWTDQSGKAWTKDSPAFKIAEGYTYAVTFTKGGSPITTLAVEEGVQPTEVTPVLTKTASGGTKTTETINTSTTHNVVWTSTDSVKAELKKDVTTGIGNITGLSANSIAENVAVTVTDKNGIKGTATLPTTVGAAAYKMEFLPAVGATWTIGSIDAQANASTGTNGTATKFYVRTIDTATSKDVTTGTWTAVADNTNKILKATSNVSTESSGSKLQVVEIETDSYVGEDTLTVKFTTTKGVTYVKEIPVNTYATIRFEGTAAQNTLTKKDYVVTVDGEEVATRTPAKLSYTEMHLFASDGVKSKDDVVTGFENVNIQKYAEVYKDTNTVPLVKEFRGWTPDAGVTVLYGTVESLRWSGAFTNGVYTLKGVMDDKVEISGLPGTITLSDDATDSVAVLDNIEITPATDSTPKLKFDTDTVNIFRWDNAGSIYPGTIATSKTNEITKGSIKSGVRTDKVSFGKITKALGTPKAGKATLVFYASNPEKGQTVTLYVNGLDTTDGVTRYYEQGELVKNDKRTVGSTTYYFDENGEQVTGTKIIELNGKKVLIVGGIVAPKGRQTYNDKWYYIGNDGELQYGWLTATGAAAAATLDDAVYYADPTTGILGTSELLTIDSKNYYFQAESTLARGSATANLYEKIDNYYINKKGEVAVAELFTMDGKQYLANEKGELVTYAMTTGGKITINGIGYAINQADNTATLDDVLYAPSVKFTWPKNYEKGKDLTVTWTGTVKSKSASGATKPISGNAIVSPAPSTVSAGNVDKKIEFTATADLSQYWKDEAMSAKAENATDKKTYNFKNGSVSGNTGGDVSEDGEAESEPEVTENTTTWNLFYTTEPLKVEVPEGAKHNSSTGYVEGTGKWTTYFGIGPDGTVHYSGAAKDRKKAANAGNSLIVIPLYGTDDSGAEVQTGEFEYQLPVYYQKPSLKLTSTTGNVKVNGGDQTLKTQVTQKKSNGAYEPLNVDAEGAVKLENWKNTQPTFEVDESVITFTATAKGNGNVAVQLPTWSDKISLKYTVKESKKNVLTGSTKQLVFNLNDVTNTAEQEFTLFYNSGDLNSGDPVTVTLPKKWADAKIEGIENGELSAQTMTLKFADGATPKKGTYSVKFSTKDKAAFTLKVVVSNADLKKNAISLKYQSKIDLTTGQKGVVIPTLKGVNGPIEDVALDDVSAAKFEVEYNEATNQIIVTPVEGQVTVGKNGNVTFKITAGGVPCETTIKNFQVAGKMPAVKVSSVKLPKTKVIAGTATGESNVLCTYKQGGKTFSTTPIEFSVNGGTKTTSEDTVVGEGWWKVDKANVYVQYDAETGRMHVHSIANAKGKGGTVKCEFKFAGQTKVKKANFKIAIDSKK